MIFIQRITIEDKTMTRAIYEFQELKKVSETSHYNTLWDTLMGNILLKFHLHLTQIHTEEDYSFKECSRREKSSIEENGSFLMVSSS